MERAKHTPSVWIATADDWLIKAGKIDVGEVLWCHDGRGVHYTDAQPALDAQYGKLTFTAGNHGKALWVRRNTSRQKLAHAASITRDRRGASHAE